MTTFSPREIVSDLDRHIVGQKDAKRAVAITAAIGADANRPFTIESLEAV